MNSKNRENKEILPSSAGLSPRFTYLHFEGLKPDCVSLLGD